MAGVAVGGADVRINGLIRENPMNSVDNWFIFIPHQNKKSYRLSEKYHFY